MIRALHAAASFLAVAWFCAVVIAWAEVIR